MPIRAPGLIVEQAVGLGVSPIWHGAEERDDAGEPAQLVHQLGIKSGMTVADIGAGSGYYVVRLSPQKMSCPNTCGPCAACKAP